ncbi:Ni/Fe-hydrogenase cytochrome b subunit [Desulfonema ishimotonii]|uniref:Ni/Fe-hydrogenase cytochrome b subunit n=1 Tax=Desulfonema ishimotonii TaxID=45657 RepID=A0A401FZC9_9BACT|nr:hypothetical protein [Desulfonema ishimotonii]GBC62324.1 Ni/Fe-hydrogenase cytochrome b subunit [Desulfonema ishimotonii]
MSEETIAVKTKFFPPGRSFYTPFNVVAGIIILIGLILTVMRFTGGCPL